MAHRLEDGSVTKNVYCSVIVGGKLDSMTFPNPEKDPEAEQWAIKRARNLREEGKHAYPVLITEIVDWREILEGETRFTRYQLEKMRLTKNELWRRMGLPETGVDVALPQDWLNWFVKETRLDYNLVIATTFYVYEKGHAFGHPVSGCIEVQKKLDEYCV